MLVKHRFTALMFTLACLFAWTNLPALANAQSEQEVDARIKDNLSANTPGEYKAFFTQLQQAVASSDKQTVAKMLRYPVRATHPAIRIATVKDFIAHYDEIFTPNVIKAVQAQTYANLFVRDQGVMIGNGEIWFSGVCAEKACTRRVIKVTGINN